MFDNVPYSNRERQGASRRLRTFLYAATLSAERNVCTKLEPTAAGSPSHVSSVTPKALYTTAQGRAAHPGSRRLFNLSYSNRERQGASRRLRTILYAATLSAERNVCTKLEPTAAGSPSHVSSVTPKALYTTAQGRAAHAGSRRLFNLSYSYSNRERQGASRRLRAILYVVTLSAERNVFTKLEPTAAGSPSHNRPFRFLCQLLAILTFVLFAQSAHACRYTIRDIGFVDMQGPAYTLWLVNGDAELADQAKTWLGPCNVQVAVVAASASDHPIVVALNENQVDLTEPTGKHIVLAAPDRQPLPLGSASNKEGYELLVRAVVESPVRNQIQREALETFAFVVTRDVEEAVVNKALDRLREFESQLPRSIDHPVTKLRLDAKQAAEEKVLLWSLGFPTEGPAAAVLYGRGKRLGNVLTEASTTTEAISMQLAFVGESCECETDRDWVNEPTVPMRWGPDQWEQTRTLLGFDPASPLVKAEVVRIIGKGIRPDDAQDKAPSEDLASMLLGYREVDVPSDPDPVSDQAESTVNEGESVSPSLAESVKDKPQSEVPDVIETDRSVGSKMMSGTLIAAAVVTFISFAGVAFLLIRRGAS